MNSYNAPRHSPLFSPSFLDADDWDLGLVLTKQYILRVGLIKEKIFVQFKVSNCFSDIQKLFSVIRDSGRNITYKISYKQHKKTHKLVKSP